MCALATIGIAVLGFDFLIFMLAISCEALEENKEADRFFKIFKFGVCAVVAIIILMFGVK